MVREPLAYAESRMDEEVDSTAGVMRRFRVEFTGCAGEKVYLDVLISYQEMNYFPPNLRFVNQQLLDG